MTQSRLHSLIEANVNTFVGFFISLIFWSIWIVPMYNMKVTFIQNLEITAQFTVLAIARGYIVRRWFNSKGPHAKT